MKKAQKLQTETVIHPVTKIGIDSINLNDWNPNFVNGHIKSAIKDDINQNGFIDPIVVQKHNKKLKKDNVIINGEHRYKIMKDRGMKEISAIVLDVPDKKAKALTIRLNREHGELYPDKMSLLLKDLSPKLDYSELKEITFLDQDEVLAYTEINTDEIDKQRQKLREKPKVKNKFSKDITCPKCGHEFEIP